MVARFQKLDHRGVGLGLGGEVGAGHGLKLFAGGALVHVGQGPARQGGRNEVHHIGVVQPQSELEQQIGVVADQVRIRLQEGAYGRPRLVCQIVGSVLDLVRFVHTHPRPLF